MNYGNIKRMLLFITFISLLITAVNAEDVSNDTSNAVLSNDAEVQCDNIQTDSMDIVASEEHSDKNLIKKKDTGNVKTTSKSYNVNNFEELYGALSNWEYDTVTVNIKSDIVPEYNLDVSESIKKLTFNGNGKTFDGKNTYTFLYIPIGCRAVINDYKVINCCEDSRQQGGGLYNLGDLTVNNVKFVNNRATQSYGGSIYNMGKLNVQNSEFQNSFANIYGGAIYSEGNLVINNSKFINNKGDNTIYVEDSDVKIENTIVNKSYPGFYEDILTNNCTVSIINLKMTNSTCIANENNGIMTIKSSIFSNNKNGISNDGRLTIINSTIINNSPQSNGAIHGYGILSIVNSTFKNNKAVDFNGGAVSNVGNLTVRNSIFSNNSAIGKESVVYGGAIYNDNGIVSISTSTFSDNNAYNGGAVFLNNSKLTISNSSFKNSKDKYNTIYLKMSDSTIINNSKFENAKIANVYSTLRITNSQLNKAQINSTYSNITLDNTTIKSNKTKSISLAFNGNLTVNNSTFKNIGSINAEIYKKGNNINISNSIFEENYGTVDLNGIINIVDVIFNNNHANKGILNCNGSATIRNSKFYNNVQKNNSPYGIVNSLTHSNLTVINTIFENNTSQDGAICADGQTIVKKCTFNANNGSNGAAIQNNGTLTINSSIFKNNNAKNNGGAICNLRNLTIENSQFTGNHAKNNGGAIFSENSKQLKVQKSNFTNNRAGNNGGAIYSENVTQMLVSNSIFTDNRADNNGGAIYDKSNNNIIQSNIFTHNAAIRGSAIYLKPEKLKANITEYMEVIEPGTNNRIKEPVIANYYSVQGGNGKIHNNTFKENNAKVKGKAIIINGTNNTLKGNINDTICLDSSTIDLNAVNYVISNNIFRDKYIHTKIALTLPDNVTYNNTVKLTGKLITLDGKDIPNANIKIIINTKAINIKTNNKGIYNYSFKATKSGINNVTALYNGDNKYAPISTTKTIKVLETTSIIINKISAVEYKDNVIIKGKFIRKGGTAIKNSNLKLKINSQTYTVKTDNNGIYNKTITAEQVGKNNITVSFTGNNNFKASTNKATFTVNRRTTKITIKSIEVKTYKANVTVSGNLTDKSKNPLKTTEVKININGITYKATTNINGLFTKTVSANRTGTNNVTVTYQGNKTYNAVNAKTTFKTLQRATKITVNKIKDTTIGTTVNITGKLTDNIGDVFRATAIKLRINGKLINTKTDNRGIYKYSFKTTIPGRNNITVTYPGNINYKNSEAKISVTVNKKVAMITINKIATKTFKDNYTVTGNLTDSTNNPLKNVEVKIVVNGKAYDVKTNNKGIFTKTLVADRAGTNNVSAVYEGSTYYKSTNSKTTFKTLQRTTKITLKNIPNTTKNATVTITGKLTDSKGESFDSLVNITINNQIVNIRTKSNGTYTYKFKATTIGQNNITVAYAGNRNYKSTSIKTSFMVE
ncbi:MAG: hypothetical protein BZ138_08235 [Methanosphaera sp. rholeuAM270]|nr:MAG: hypothetical protein BZ138_08235 [Methanosphaera sp. rholeuAM270]